MAKKLKTRLSALAARAAGTAYAAQPREVPGLGGDNVRAANAFRTVLTGQNPQSLATDAGVIPLPDEEELEKVRRRRAARRGGGRASTVLSDENRLGG